MTRKNTFLQFDFKERGADTIAPRFFSNPIDIIQTNEPAEVTEAFNKIQAYLDEGFYAAGYVSFEATYPLTNMIASSKQTALPLLWFGIFKSFSTPEEKPSKAFQTSPWISTVTQATYDQKSKIIHEHLKNGLIDEINYTIPFQAHFTGDSLTYYHQLQKAQSANYGAYIHTRDFNILSASPELFYEIKDKVITMRPMKGTIHRGLSAREDKDLKNWLAHSKKNQFENQLTIDLMEKEMKKVARPESIHVTEKFAIEKYPTVYQMTSTVTGDIKADLSATEIFKRTFPCSSIAGVPKVESLKLIQALENTPREVYCGSMGYFAPNGDAVFNVAIRTVWINSESKQAHYGAGGGITKHSDIVTEYEEVFTKTRVLDYKLPSFELLETIGLFDGDYLVLDYHLKRLKNSIDYFDWKVSLNEIVGALEDLRKVHAKGSFRVRLTVKDDGTFQLTCHHLKEFKPSKIQLATQPVDKNEVFLYHKTTFRKMFEKTAGRPAEPLTLYSNEAGEVTEFAIGNLVIKKDGRLITPTLSSGLLPGTFRQMLIDTGQVIEDKVYLEDLQKAEKIWMINSVRQWVHVTF